MKNFLIYATVCFLFFVTLHKNFSKNSTNRSAKN